VRVLARLVLLAGAAALVALLVRDAVATRVARALAGPVRALVALAPRIRIAVAAAPSGTILPLLPQHELPHVPLLPTPIAPKRVAAHAAPAKRHVVTRKEVEEAIATRLSGANAVLVKDEDGKPLGLRLTGVGRLAPFGVRDGDILVAANGLPLRTADEAISALGALKDSKHVTVTLRRGAGSYSVPLDLEESPPSPQ
jgi:membrane-associated protease RseP (regulator of RpoE activity)